MKKLIVLCLLFLGQANVLEAGWRAYNFLEIPDGSNRSIYIEFQQLIDDQKPDSYRFSLITPQAAGKQALIEPLAFGATENAEGLRWELSNGAILKKNSFLGEPYLYYPTPTSEPLKLRSLGTSEEVLAARGVDIPSAYRTSPEPFERAKVTRAFKDHQDNLIIFVDRGEIFWWDALSGILQPLDTIFEPNSRDESGIYKRKFHAPIADNLERRGVLEESKDRVKVISGSAEKLFYRISREEAAYISWSILNGYMRMAPMQQQKVPRFLLEGSQSTFYLVEDGYNTKGAVVLISQGGKIKEVRVAGYEQSRGGLPSIISLENGGKLRLPDTGDTEQFPAKFWIPPKSEKSAKRLIVHKVDKGTLKKVAVDPARYEYPLVPSPCDALVSKIAEYRARQLALTKRR